MKQEQDLQKLLQDVKEKELQLEKQLESKLMLHSIDGALVDLFVSQSFFAA